MFVAGNNQIESKVLPFALRQFGLSIAGNDYEALETSCISPNRLIVSARERPALSGVELICKIRQSRNDGHFNMVVPMSRAGKANVVDCQNGWVDNFIAKHFDPPEPNAGEQIWSLESQDGTVFSLAKLAESRDPETGGHLERIREYCRVLAQSISTNGGYGGQVDQEFVQLVYLASPLHDIGKVGIPASVLLKPGPLNDGELAMVREHTVIGGRSLDATLQAHPEVRFLRMAREIAWTHHENFDGSGYPRGLIGEEIPLCGRIVAVADVYDALTTRRVYKEPYSHDMALSIILAGSGKQFDPLVVDAFLKNEGQFASICREFDHGENTTMTFRSGVYEMDGVQDRRRELLGSGVSKMVRNTLIARATRPITLHRA